MTGEVGVRDAVRQLGRAVGTLVRAVVGSVRRTRPAAAPSGPPQEWLDLVAETDPAWLASSRWADRVDRKRPRVREVVEVPPPVDEAVPVVEPREARAVYEEEPVVEEPRPRRETRVHQQPRLLPVEDEAPRAPSRARRAALEPVVADDARVPADTAPLRTAAARPTETGPAPQPPAPETTAAPYAAPPRPHPYVTPPDVHRPPAEAPDVRTAPEHPRHETAPLPAHISELGTWSPREAATRRSTPATPPAAPTWPELPRTDDLDDSTAGAGLAARLWSADAPDALTLAQRRS